MRPADGGGLIKRKPKRQSVSKSRALGLLRFFGPVTSRGSRFAAHQADLSFLIRSNFIEQCFLGVEPLLLAQPTIASPLQRQSERYDAVWHTLAKCRL